MVYFLLHNIYKFSSYLTGITIHLLSVARNSEDKTTEAAIYVAGTDENVKLPEVRFGKRRC
jgi:hypothetical protein